MKRLLIAMAVLALIKAVSLALASRAEAQVSLVPGLTYSQDSRGGALAEIALDRAVPWRVRLLTDPWRLIVELDGFVAPIDVAALAEARLIARAALVPAGDGASGIVLTLTRPATVESAAMAVGAAGATITLRLDPASEAAARAESEPPETPAATGPSARTRMRVVIDPGHGGVDPGAVARIDGVEVRESDIVLAQARELRDILRRTGRFDVFLTREDDVFVPLDLRREAATGADIFLSIHADALAEGRAEGASVYTFDPSEGDRATQALIERHGRDAALDGARMEGTGDDVASVLVEMARAAVQPKSDLLGDLLVEHIGAQTGSLHKAPRGRAGFAVLGGADAASALVEIGYLTGEDQIERIASPPFRRAMAQGILDALLAYERDVAALRALERR